jgi:hypothetical protein
MKVFISWSGDKSYAVAEALRDWLPKVIQALRPFLSAKDIDKGTQWQEKILKNLDEARTGIICLTKDNLTAPWLLFEAGALSKSVKNYTNYVCTYLIDVTPTDVREPLTQFQHTTAEKEDTRKLIKTLNRAIKESGKDGGLDETQVDQIFEVWWEHLEGALKKISESFQAGGPPQPERDDRDILKEILSLVRTLAKERPVYYYSFGKPNKIPEGYKNFILPLTEAPSDEE